MYYAIGVVACWKNPVRLRESQDELERLITESCRSILNFFQQPANPSFRSALWTDYMNPLSTFGYIGVNFWIAECKQTDSSYFSSSAITPSHVSPGAVF